MRQSNNQHAEIVSQINTSYGKMLYKNGERRKVKKKNLFWIELVTRGLLDQIESKGF
jgi:hypothetical protein